MSSSNKTQPTMRDVHVHLESTPSKSYYVQKAANSMDIDLNKKLTHDLRVSCDIDTSYTVGVIVGASGSGKTSLAHELFGDFNDTDIDHDTPVIDQFPDAWDYATRQSTLASIGLTSVPCWCRPYRTLSTGQQDRADVALRMAHNGDATTVIDEFTSRVDRKVATVMAHCVQKHARRNDARVVCVTCHRDVIEWLRPDWVIDCDTQEFIDMRDVEHAKKKSSSRCANATRPYGDDSRSITICLNI